MHIKVAGEHLGKEEDTKRVLQGRTRKNLTVAAELRQQQTSPFCAETFHKLAGLFLPK